MPIRCPKCKSPHWYKPIIPTWSSLSDRPKTLKALGNVISRLSPTERQVLQRRLEAVYAPPTARHGQVCPLDELRIDKSVNPVFVYLAPVIEELSQEYVDSVVAHEFAHVILTHSHEVVDDVAEVEEMQESEANKRLQAWGFAPILIDTAIVINTAKEIGEFMDKVLPPSSSHLQKEARIHATVYASDLIRSAQHSSMELLRMTRAYYDGFLKGRELPSG